MERGGFSGALTARSSAEAPCGKTTAKLERSVRPPQLQPGQTKAEVLMYFMSASYTSISYDSLQHVGAQQLCRK